MGDPSSLELYFTQGQGPGQILHNKMQKETKKVSRQHVNCAAGESCGPYSPFSILVAERWTLGGQARKARTFLCERKNAASSRARRGQAAVGGGFCMSRNTQGAEEGREGGREGDTETDTWQSYHQPPLCKTINTNFLKEQWIKEANRWNFTFQQAFYFESIHWVKETHEISVLDNFLKIKSKCLPGPGPGCDHQQQQQQEPVGSRRQGGHCNYCPGRRCLVPPHANTRD